MIVLFVGFVVIDCVVVIVTYIDTSACFSVVTVVVVVTLIVYIVYIYIYVLLQLYNCCCV